jgi:hypothetical protein
MLKHEINFIPLNDMIIEAKRIMILIFYIRRGSFKYILSLCLVALFRAGSEYLKVGLNIVQYNKNFEAL